jgi:hypothetical protein
VDARARAYVGEPPTRADRAVVIVATMLDGGLGKEKCPRDAAKRPGAWRRGDNPRRTATVDPCHGG